MIWGSLIHTYYSHGKFIAREFQWRIHKPLLLNTVKVKLHSTTVGEMRNRPELIS